MYYSNSIIILRSINSPEDHTSKHLGRTLPAINVMNIRGVIRALPPSLTLLPHTQFSLARVAGLNHSSFYSQFPPHVTHFNAYVIARVHHLRPVTYARLY